MVKDTHSHVFGAFVDGGLHSRQPDWYGVSESCLFQLSPRFRTYFSRKKKHWTFCRRSFFGLDGVVDLTKPKWDREVSWPALGMSPLSDGFGHRPSNAIPVLVPFPYSSLLLSSLCPCAGLYHAQPPVPLPFMNTRELKGGCKSGGKSVTTSPKGVNNAPEQSPPSLHNSQIAATGIPRAMEGRWLHEIVEFVRAHPGCRG